MLPTATSHCVGLRQRLPRGRQEVVEFVLIGHPGQAREDVLDVDEGVDPVPLAGDDDGVNDSGAVSGLGMTNEHPVFLPDRRGSDRVFDQIIVETRAAVVAMHRQDAPVIKQIGAGLAQRRLGPDQLVKAARGQAADC